jgi:hypothetical protein
MEYDSDQDEEYDSDQDEEYDSPRSDQKARQTHDQQLLTPLRESIFDKPPYITGTLQLPDSFLSLFYMVARDGHASRFEDGDP